MFIRGARISCRSRWAAVLMGGLLFLTLAGFAAVPTAFAHTALTKASPANEEVLDEAPARVELWFREPVKVSQDSIRVSGPGMSSAVASEARRTPGEPNHVQADLITELPSGTYVVSYYVVAQDGHPLQGELRFTIEAAEEAPPEKGEEALSAMEKDEGQTPQPTLPPQPPQEPVERTDKGVNGMAYWILAGLLLAAWITLRVRKGKRDS